MASSGVDMRMPHINQGSPKVASVPFRKHSKYCQHNQPEKIPYMTVRFDIKQASIIYFRMQKK
jgi:hypothetical protein